MDREWRELSKQDQALCGALSMIAPELRGAVSVPEVHDGAVSIAGKKV
jgi:hypothetical protein